MTLSLPKNSRSANMVRLAILAGFVILAATLVNANTYSVYTCLCETRRHIFNLQQFEYHSNTLRKTWTFRNTCSNKFYRVIHWRDKLYWKKSCFHKPEKICGDVDAEGAQFCVTNGYPALNGTSHFYELNRHGPNRGVVKLYLQHKDQWDCTDECRAQLVPRWGTDGSVKSFCNRTRSDGVLEPAAKYLPCGTQVINDLMDF